MPEETFAKVLELLPAVEDQGFWLSCLHEPTLHPRMNRLIEMIPAAHRRKTWFTTNLARPLADEVFTGWTESGLHHINISLDTLDEELFAKLRKFGRFGVFKDNLDRLTSIFAARPQAPELRYITMALKPNLHEIARVVEYSREHWLASANEVRYTYKYSHMNEQFHREYSLEKHDWEYLDEVLGALRYPCTIERPPEGEEVTVSMNYDLTRGSQIPQIQKHERPLRLRARPNGNMLLIDWEGRFSANINSLDKPLDYFRQF
jgi:MoaA/NifB/PqqE/SkfB family radical SAM enzyme